MKAIFILLSFLCSIYGLFAQNFSEDEIAKINSGDTTQMMRVIQITEPEELRILTTPSRDIAWNDPLLPLLRQRMYLAMRDPGNEGIGIAAPQVGINRNVIWVQRFDKAGSPFEFYINPKIIWYSGLRQLGPEGCLSIPDIRGDVMRSYAIELSYYTMNGAHHTEVIEDFTAVVFQHEYDHLLGILFPRRLEEQKKENYSPIHTTEKKLFVEPIRIE